ncbi:ABC transporter ATP-binding protein [Deinococcus apachensis]|uniref:ABC transporter ATP-binding protein n=1 Tax=Deinococcus apachensis TaxID=309886 RepID=UPI00037FA230|nr:ABC transporter transmembrane domain-containing protein [Deinococcus apachensis]
MTSPPAGGPRRLPRPRLAWPEWGKLRRLLGYVRPYRGALAAALVATVLFSGLSLVFPALVGRVLDAATGGAADAGGLNLLALGLMGVFVVRALVGMVQAYLLSRVGESVVNDLRCALYDHLVRLPIRFYDRHHTGELTSRLGSDVLTVQSAASHALSQLLGQGLVLVGGVAVLLRTSPRLSLVMLSVVPLVVLCALLFGRWLQQVSVALQDREARAQAHAQETLSNIRVVQAFVTEQAESGRYRALAGAALRTALARARIDAAYTPSVTLLMAGSASVVLWYGSRLVLAGELSTGTLIAFLLYTVTVINAMGALAGVYGQLQQAVGASERVFALLGEPVGSTPPAHPVPLGRPRGGVRFEGVSFQYDPSGPVVVRDLTLDVRPGEIVALVGPSGAGKSTVAALLARFYDPTAGRVLIDGTDLRAVDVRAWRRHLGWVAQEVQLFSGSVRENLCYGQPEATDAEVEAAARAANAHEFIGALPQGYDTPVGERGIQLSGGQRQRVAIARALLRDPRVLLLDEATSSLDSESEALVQQALERLMTGRTSFVIAHRLSTVRRADRIVVFREGQVVQQGDHRTLLAEGGLYRDLYELQFRLEAQAVAE